MNAREYLNTITAYDIRQYGFDTHARVLNLPKDKIKKMWNEATGYEFKRFPRTEYTLLTRPSLSTPLKPYWEVVLPKEQYLMFYLTPTTPILIPNGFITDKGSIPFFLRGIIAHDDRDMMLAYLIHDVECEMKRMLRFTTDGLLYEVGTEMNANWLKKNIVYSAVRSVAWRNVSDRTRNGFNVSQHNRNLINATEQMYLQHKHTEHLDFLQEVRTNRGKI